MSIYEETKQIMRENNIYANKSLGQNFLVNEEVVEQIINASELTKEDLVIEIGPGLGTLTKYLLEHAGKVICVELDNKMINILQKRFKENTSLEILNQDILKIDLNKLIQEEKNNLKNVKIVANLPYYITTPIIMKLLENNLDINSITVMVQLEVAERLIATPGDKKTGAITYSVYYYSKAKQICNVPKSSFIPEPNVESQVIKLEIRDNPPVKINDKERLFKIIKAAFLQRRKTLSNALVNSNIFTTKQEVEEILSTLNIPLNVRGEQLTLEQFAQIESNVPLGTFLRGTFCPKRDTSL